MKINQLIFTVLGSLCLASHASSSQIEQQDLNEIKPGITTEIDLAHRFGPPDTRVVDTRVDRLLHWTKFGAPPPRGYLPIIGSCFVVLDVCWLELWAHVRAYGRVETSIFQIE